MRRCSFALLTLLLLASRVVSQATSPHPIDGSQKFFEDDRIRVAIPAGWSLHTATEHVRGNKPFDLPIGVILTKDKYKVYLLTHKGQASGVEGGRFSEVVAYISPWVGMSELPAVACSPKRQEENAPGKMLSREDFYFDTTRANAQALSDCGNPTVKGTLWYGSYFVETCSGKDHPEDCGGFFLTYQNLSGKPPEPQNERQMVYSVTYDTTTPDTLPKKNDPTLQKVLKEANQIVDSIVYK